MAGDGSKPHVEQPGPAEFHDPLIRREFQRAWVWIGSLLLVAAVILLSQPLLLIVGGLVFAVLLDGGTRLLGRYLPLPRGVRLAIVTLAGFGFLGWVLWYAGTTFAAQFEALRLTVEAQVMRLYAWAASHGLVPEGSSDTVVQQLLGSLGRVTSVVGSAIGAFTSAFLILIIGIFFAVEPKVYDRGVAWMLPMRHRGDYYAILSAVGCTLRRLLFGRLVGMVVEGLFTFGMLWAGGVPMAALLGLLTGILAFIPNLGAITSGVLMVAVGFSAGPDQGLWAIFTYFAVQNIDGYLILPYIARKTVDLAPAVVLAAQLIFGALFGFLGLLLADTIMAALKVTLEQLAERRSPDCLTDPAQAPDPAAAGQAPRRLAEAAARPAPAPGPPHSGPPASP
ncbi:AI-2E family transporter [Sphingomonas sp. LHG3443-2]|uniref:AI-2E family transporter n=1 Tax=Sphingomonas sp. LHG3443-2 TaxID=2804639 RepID=UPI003CECAC8E